MENLTEKEQELANFLLDKKQEINKRKLIKGKSVIIPVEKDGFFLTSFNSVNENGIRKKTRVDYIFEQKKWIAGKNTPRESLKLKGFDISLEKIEIEDNDRLLEQIIKDVLICQELLSEEFSRLNSVERMKIDDLKKVNSRISFKLLHLKNKK